jgi:hypothetical protein
MRAQIIDFIVYPSTPQRRTWERRQPGSLLPSTMKLKLSGFQHRITREKWIVLGRFSVGLPDDTVFAQ